MGIYHRSKYSLDYCPSKCIFVRILFVQVFSAFNMLESVSSDLDQMKFVSRSSVILPKTADIKLLTVFFLWKRTTHLFYCYLKGKVRIVDSTPIVDVLPVINLNTVQIQSLLSRPPFSTLVRSREKSKLPSWSVFIDSDKSKTVISRPIALSPSILVNRQ